ncbi:MAG: DUF3108 domain-containing protein [Bacteroidetes bacterium]|nr:DUF3108 domain-containing protein [Bacteroidota bacterium]MBU1421589.1 DUF3108 domain-containing protein [Bacteroidota bacterium]
MLVYKTISILIFVLFVAITTKALKDSVTIKKDTISVQDTLAVKDTLDIKKFIFRTLPNKAFDVGEKLVFDVRYGFITAGTAVMQIPKSEFHNGRKCYRVEFTVKSLPFFSTFYKVEDKYVSLIDSAGIFPWRFEQYIREGGYKRDFKAEFDHANNKAITLEGEYTIEPYVHDIISAFYFNRIMDYSEMRGGTMMHLKNFYKDSTYNLNVRFRGRERISVKAGTFDCVIVEPIVEEGGLFKSEGIIHIWLTDDDKKIPVMVKSKILIGSISAELVEYSGIKGKIQAKVK